MESGQMAAGQDKPPFDQLVHPVSRALLQQAVGVRSQEGKFSFPHPGAAQFRRFIRDELCCDLYKFGDYLGLSAARVSELLSAAEGDREKQIDYILLAWVESNGERATIEEVFRAIYAADDTQAIENIVKKLGDSDSTLQRDILVPRMTPGYTDSDVIPSPPTQTHFIGENEEIKLSKRVGRLSMVTNMPTKRLESNSDLTPVELPPDVSLQRPLEETSLTKEVHVDMHQQHSVGAESETSAEALMPMEESHLAPSVAATSTVVTAFSTPQGMVTSMGDTTFEEKHGSHGSHEMVSGDRRMERMQSDIEELYKNVTKMESNLEEVKSEQQRESLLRTQRNTELDMKLRQLEKDNETLRETVTALQDELKETKEKLREALEEVTKLREDKRDLNDSLIEERALFDEEREKFRVETETLHKQAAVTEREKAELRDTLEQQAVEWKSCQERYEKELTEMKGMLVKVREEIKQRRDQNTTDSPGESQLQKQGVGSDIGDWIWKEKLGSGGFGEVFVAQKKGCSDDFAAKRITLKDSDLFDKQAEVVSSFFKEMKVLQGCRHARIVQYVGRAIVTEESTIHFYLIMEYMPQGSLADLLKREKKLDELRVKRFTGQLLEGLRYLHQRDVIHRDIKCSNILLEDSGDIKLADFGCVKLLSSKQTSGVKMTGTAWWMAPELVPGGKQSDAASEKSDVWSVGATVVEMLTGNRPFSEYTEKMAVIFGLGMGKLSLDKLISGPGFSEEVQEFLKLCINWEPSQRATVAQLLGSPFVLS